MSKVKGEKMRGVDVELHATTGGFWEFIRVSDHEVIGRSKDVEKARAQASRALSAKVEVRFINLEGEEGVATGIHAANGNILCRVGERTFQLSRYEGRSLLRGDIPPEKLEELREALREKERIEEKIKAIQDEFRAQLETEVKAALDPGGTDAKQG